MRHIDDDERRARLARRHAIHPAARAVDLESATRAMTVLHATEPATIQLSLVARVGTVEPVTPAEIDRALFAERSLVKQLAMRRTLFVFPRDLLPAAWGSASRRVALAHRARLAKEVQAGGITTDGDAWVAAAGDAVMAHLAEGPDGAELSAQQLREQVPELAGRVDLAAGSSYAANVAVAPRLLTQLGLEARLVRGRNAGHWRVSRPLWTPMAGWLGEQPQPTSTEEGYAELVRRWLRTFGPGSTVDLQWWLGATLGAVRRALVDVEALEVSLDGGGTGWVLPDDAGPVQSVEPWAALLPVLDPTMMGWKQRGFYLGPHAAALFDRNGNAGTTAWWDGRVVGCWVQDAAGVVEVRLLENVPASGRAALSTEAERLTGWLGGQRVGTVYPSPAMRAATWNAEGWGRP